MASSLTIQNAMWHNKKPDLSYVFSEDDVGGKIKVKNFF